MPEPRSRIYELALRALDEQERSLDELRSRVALVVAAAGVGATLLTKPAFAGSNPDGTLAIGATIVGLVGAGFLIAAVTYLLISRPLAFSIDGEDALDMAERFDLLDKGDDWYVSMILGLSERRAGNEPIIDRLHTAFSVAVGGLIVELAGFSAAAAVAS